MLKRSSSKVRMTVGSGCKALGNSFYLGMFQTFQNVFILKDPCPLNSNPSSFFPPNDLLLSGVWRISYFGESLPPLLKPKHGLGLRSQETRMNKQMCVSSSFKIPEGTRWQMSTWGALWRDGTQEQPLAPAVSYLCFSKTLGAVVPSPLVTKLSYPCFPRLVVAFQCQERSPSTLGDPTQ